MKAPLDLTRSSGAFITSLSCYCVYLDGPIRSLSDAARGLGADWETTSWSFVGGPQDEFNVAIEETPPATWNGVIVVGGTVSVFGDLEGKADSATAVIQVTPRPWSPLSGTPVTEVDQDFYADMPTVPTSQQDLAHVHHAWPMGTDIEEIFARRVTIEGGPNHSLVYVSAPFVQAYGARTEINRDALTDSQNPWYQSHPSGGPPTTCRRSDLPTTVLDFFVDRMADEAEAVANHWPQLTFHATQEALVASSVNALTSAWAAALTAEIAILDGVREQLGPAVPPCTLLY